MTVIGKKDKILLLSVKKEVLYMLLLDFETFCSDSALVWQVVGWILMIFKIIIPLLLIILGAIDFGKAVVAGKDDEVKKSAKTFAMRAVAAAIIFLIPAIVRMVFNWVMDFTGSDLDYEVCSQCVVSPSKCDTSGAVDFSGE